MPELPHRSNEDRDRDGIAVLNQMLEEAFTVPEPTAQSYTDERGRPTCPVCEGFGYFDVDGEPECDVCQGNGVATVAAVAAWRERQLDERRASPLARWANAVPCERCGAPAGEPCGCFR
jgi:DnaJ-class molecular chaperone